jgi:hypothetical protein
MIVPIVILFATLLVFFMLRPTKRPKRIVLLTSARMNGTIILRCFGQIPGVGIRNEMSTYFHHKNVDKKDGIAWDSEPDAEHAEQINHIIKTTQNCFFHEMAGDLTLTELQALKKNGFIIVAVIRLFVQVRTQTRYDHGTRLEKSAEIHRSHRPCH